MCPSVPEREDQHLLPEASGRFRHGFRPGRFIANQHGTTPEQQPIGAHAACFTNFREDVGVGKSRSGLIIAQTARSDADTFAEGGARLRASYRADSFSKIRVFHALVQRSGLWPGAWSRICSGCKPLKSDSSGFTGNRHCCKGGRVPEQLWRHPPGRRERVCVAPLRCGLFRLPGGMGLSPFRPGACVRSNTFKHSAIPFCQLFFPAPVQGAPNEHGHRSDNTAFCLKTKHKKEFLHIFT